MHWYLNFFEKFNQTLYLFSRSFAPDSRFSEFSTDCSKVLETIEKTTIIKPQYSITNEGSRFSEFSVDCSKALETIEKQPLSKLNLRRLDSRFSEFSANCSKALETIEKTTRMGPVKPHEKVILIVYPDPEYRDRKRLKEQFEVSSSSIWHKIDF